MDENTQEIKNRGWQVTMAGTGINLALGILYAWSIISGGIPKEWGWNDTDKSLPYSIAILVFAFTTVPAGRLQDKIGPRWVALAGGVFVGIGLILASLTTSVAGFVVGFGVFGGAGIGMGYACATPPAVKWFPPSRTGLIAGLVVSGFGLAAAYISPLANALIDAFSTKDAAGKVLDSGPGIHTTLLILGIAFFVVVSILSQLLRNPPPGWKPAAPAPVAGAAPAKPAIADVPWIDMLKTPQFWLLWVMYLFAAGAGLMIVGKMKQIVGAQTTLDASRLFVFVAILSLGNASGRIAAGALSDRIGRRNTFLIVFLFQAALMFSLRFIDSPGLFVPYAFLLGGNYGANLALFPSVTKDYWGLKNFGVNYGFIFTAWGVGGFLFPLLGGKVYDLHKNYHLSFLIAGACLVLAAFLLFALKPPKPKEAPAPAPPAAPPA